MIQFQENAQTEGQLEGQTDLILQDPSNYGWGSIMLTMHATFTITIRYNAKFNIGIWFGRHDLKKAKPGL